MNYSSLKVKLIKLKNDNINGASLISNELLKLFIEANKALGKAEYLKLIKIIRTWRPPMAEVLNAIIFLTDEAHKSKDELAHLLILKISKRAEAQDKTLLNAANIIG